MSVFKTTKRQVLLRTKNLLKTASRTFAERVFVATADNDVPADGLRDREYLTVSMPGGEYLYGSQVGGVLPYRARINVVLWKVDRKDRDGTADSVTLEQTHGLFDLQHQIVQRCFLSYLNEGLDGQEATKILVGPLMPLSDSGPHRGADETFEESRESSRRALLTIEFSCEFHLDLSRDCDMDDPASVPVA